MRCFSVGLRERTYSKVHPSGQPPLNWRGSRAVAAAAARWRSVGIATIVVDGAGVILLCCGGKIETALMRVTGFCSADEWMGGCVESWLVAGH